ncbi:YceI family protein [Pseudogulbenkiania sp. NH8B]|uniref:YceI family protein n=1 Tax=Pseudogulbenkiania ferrooxidans 2002 TaxID=279714 RepID=B9Z8A3_9NEIS|nr:MULTISPECIES: YceI family protein [Pseudogulbenkiania]EEG07006.1 YceI family protein [Pseudogulbenkiania ferrooxidans 2002]BAK75305.1 YceI family protein [Pseudogulbenkiania sp. NH8B]
MMKQTLIAAALAGLSTAALAAPVTYNVDPTHTFAQYEVNHLGFSVQSGTFTKTSGKVELDSAAKKGAVDITIDADSLQTFLPDRDKHLKSKDFFNVAQYPTITFKSKNLEFAGDKLTALKGDLTILGVTKPVTLKVTQFGGKPNPMTGKQTYGANAETVIKRSDFGMKTFLPAIADDVVLKVAIEAVKAE